ncbi:2259_t:CDS:2, partial [Scutellospora calospora]
SSSSKFDYIPSADRILSDKATHNEDSDGYDLWDVPATPEPLRDILSGKNKNTEDIYNEEIEYSDDAHENDHDPWTMWNEPDAIDSIVNLSESKKSSEKKNAKKSPTSANTLQPVAELFSGMSVSSETTYTQNSVLPPTKPNTDYPNESKQKVEMKNYDDDYWKSQFPQSQSNESHSSYDYRPDYSHDYKKNDDRKQNLVINASVPLSSSSESFDISPATPQFNIKRQDSIGSSREAMTNSTYPLYSSPYNQHSSHNSLSQHGMYSSRASDYSSLQQSQSVGPSQTINSSSANRCSNDDMNSQRIFKTESIDDQQLTQWTGSLIKGQSAQYIGRVIVKPMKERCDNIDYL